MTKKTTAKEKTEVKQPLKKFVVDVDGVKHVVEATSVEEAVAQVTKTGDK